MRETLLFFVFRLVIRTALSILFVTLLIHALFWFLSIYGLCDWTIGSYAGWITSFFSGHPFVYPGHSESYITSDVSSRLTYTLVISSTAFILSLVVGIMVGERRAYVSSKLFHAGGYSAAVVADGIFRSAYYVLASLPAYVLAYICLIVLGMSAQHVVAVAALTIAGGVGIEVEHLTYTAQRSNLKKRYIETALSGGLPIRSINPFRGSVTNHALRNTLATVLPIGISRFPIVIGNALVIEIVYGTNGLGREFIRYVNNRDTGLVLSIFCILVIFVRVTTFVSDLVSYLLRPREIRLQVYE